MIYNAIKANEDINKCNTSIINISLPDTITYDSETVAQYQVINNICYVNLWLRQVLSSNNVTYSTSIEGLPKAAMGMSFSFIGENTKSNGLGLISGTTIMLYKLPVDNADNIAISFSCPIA